MTTYLCTSGTSAAKKLPREPRFNADWVNAHGGINDAAKLIYATFEMASMNDETALIKDLSAELHSLARMKVNARDTVVLFSSDTPDGQACAESTKLYLERAYPGIICRVTIISGLQVKDARLFRTEGVLNFTKAVLHEIESYGAANCVLNPTGGFKSLVPYTVLIGMLKGVQAKYIFEQSTALISLPMMPIEFARSRLEPIRPLLERIYSETAISRAALDAVMPFDDRAALEPLFEEIEPGQMSFSPVGFLIWEELERPTALVPFLSRRAFDDLLKIRTVEGCKPIEYLLRVSRSSEQLKNGKHENWNHGLFWLKPGQHTRDRYLASIEHGRLLVWRIVDHDEYDNLLDLNRGSNSVATRLIADRRAQYEPFVRMELYES
ncbi:putative CRISPR-associated protein [Thiospirillum jenense]|uniref:Putative CRISPR-associated protein n=1 Tax=Thiospirillum jenense TaxID=1653858 RepID=A0A839HCL7_9GAMM|nr:putative CRISPR-associated protein [Thiospirillum jenense]MBB1126673.1 putative CRISPR-associated protein [Thiospirillum jenense]